MTPTRFLDRTTPPHVVTLVLITGLSTLAMNIFLPSLPGMAEWFGVDYAVMQLAVSVYLAGSAILQLVIAPVSDRFGRRPVILAALAVFTLASFAAPLAPDVHWFLAARVVQAVVATGMALSRAVIRDMVAPDRAASMIGYVTMAMSVVPMIGPAIGGALDEALGWQACFLLLGVAGIAAFLLVWADLGETARPSGRGFAAQLREYPELLRSPRFWGYATAASLASGAFFAYLGGAPFVGETIFRLSPAEVGYYFAAPAIGYAFGNFLSGRYSVRFGINRMTLAGTAVATLALLAGVIVTELWPPAPVPFFVAVGFMAVGNGMTLPNANAGLLSVRPHLAGSASGLGGALMIGGGAILAALTGSLLEPANGHARLLEVMAVSSALSFVAVLFVIRRARRLARDGLQG